MRILITTPIFHPENHSLVHFINSFSNWAEKKGHKITIITLGKKVSEETNSNLFIINKRENYFLRNLKFAYKIYQNKEVDFIYAQHALAVALPSLLISKIFKIPLIINFSSDEVYERFLLANKNNIDLENFYKEKKLDFYFTLLQKIQGFVLRTCDKVIVPNNYFKGLILREYNIPENKIYTIYPFTELRFVLPFEAQKENFTLMTYASLSNNAFEKVKNLILTIIKLKTEFPKLKLNIFGDGQAKEELEQIVKDRKAEEYIIFHGKVSHAELIYNKKISNYFISLSPSVRNIFHILENFEYETISILKENEISKEFISQNGVLFSLSDSHNNLENIMRDIFKNENLQNQIKLEGKKKLQEKYNVENYLKEFLNICEQP